MHRYNNQDHSMLTAILAARNVMGGRYDLLHMPTPQLIERPLTVKAGVPAQHECSLHPGAEVVELC